MKITILGSGSSAGVPVVGLGWGECDPENPRNRRTRPSILVDSGQTSLLVDTSPDLRQQLLAAGIGRLDAVVYTHPHADHLHGIDDLRAVNRAMNGPIELFADAQTLETIETRFGYVLEPLRENAQSIYKPLVNPHRIGPGDAFDVGDVNIQAFDQDHGYSRTLGFRFGAAAYTTDLMEMTEQGFAAIAGVHTWVIGVFCATPHPTHVHVDKALDWVERVGPARAVFTHLSQSLDYQKLSSRLPDGVEAAYDGMVLEVPDG